MARPTFLSSSLTALSVLLVILVRVPAVPFPDSVVPAKVASLEQRVTLPIAQSSKAGANAPRPTPFSSTGILSKILESASSGVTNEEWKNREGRSIGGAPLWPFYQFIDFYEVHTEPEVFQTLQGVSFRSRRPIHRACCI